MKNGRNNKKRKKEKKPVEDFIKLFLLDPRGVIGVGIIAVFIFLAVAATLIAPMDPLTQFQGKELSSPGTENFILGTDEFGRDILSRIIYGTRVSLLVSFIAVFIASIIGVPLGLIAGYYGGVLDNIISGAIDIVIAYPAILVGMAIIVVLGPGAINVAYALAIVNIPQIARLVRSSVLVEREKMYVLNAKSIGLKQRRIIIRHIFPNVLGPIIVQVSLTMGFAVILEAALSFLGLGAQPPLPSWGSMLSDSRGLMREAWWYSVFPGVAITVFVFGIYLFSNAISKILDPKRSHL